MFCRPEAAMDYVWFLFRFEGRINRARYWLATLAMLCCIILVLVSLVKLAIAFGIRGSLSFYLVGISASIRVVEGDQPPTSWFFQIVMAPIACVFAWSYAAVSIKRLHDRNKSGWWIVPFIVVPGLYGPFCNLPGASDAAPFIRIAMFICLIWGFVEMCLLRGTRGPNRFGPDPLAPQDTRPRRDQQSEMELIPRSAGPLAGA
jgi:uncharacterized membrane protein YhaH (DUF805 family)